MRAHKNVRVVAARYRRQGVGRGRFGLEEYVAIEARADDGFPVKVGETAEIVAILVDHDDGMAFFGEFHGQF